MKKVVTFGEMMMRLKPSNMKRVLQADQFDVNYGGSEANVAVSLSMFGDQVAYVSKLPENILGQAAINQLRQFGVDTSLILRGGPRLGMYVFEKGHSVRSTNVTYDRAGSSFSISHADEYDWSKLLAGADYFYFSGVTPALSTELRQAVLNACQYCSEHGIQVACDLNFRGKLWTTAEAQEFMQKVMSYVTICIANDEDFEQSLGIHAFDGDMSHGIEQRSTFEDGMKEITKRYPNVKVVASVLRNIQSVDKSTWMGLVYRDGKFTESPAYQVDVLEGVAAGDAFGAGLMHGILNDFADQELIDHAIAASVLKLTVLGDLNVTTEADVRAVMDGGAGVRVSR
ncbi:sugar kinase [Limosilactobacillus sp.]|jgi:2-dehydro-3-deoxygluconokinase|uniref:sugar kinase n=1 Tax=Limosilactobacillus sp. TaxID=2773925 RepID=UPI0025C0B954|nr:sugar kinase [Limosilactobacillus sp.]MCH3923005.1 sugar kinase [Limosilactobacillus sp.]MCH3927688.1 sugar kinase [Limosilactobacillus sp.]